MSVKPILFNTDMVRAILDGRKTVTRRVVKHDVDAILNSPYHKEHPDVEDKQIISKLCMPPYQTGDILYVRETWCKGKIDFGEEPDGREVLYVSQCQEEEDYIHKEYVLRNGIGIDDVIWNPSIHMPKEAARIWLKVKGVRVERLQEITEEQVDAEGFRFKPPCLSMVSADGHYCDLDGPCTSSIKYCDMSMGELFGKELWDSTIKKSDINRYGWDANPWVWVIEFERYEKPEEWK